MFDETLQSEADHCLWFEDCDDDDQQPLFDEEDEDEDADDGEEDDEGQPAPGLIKYRCSPVCRLSPTVRMLVRRYSDQINELLNIWGGALIDSQYVHAAYPSFRRFSSRRERIFYAGCLTAEGEIEVVGDELRREYARLCANMLAVTGDSPRKTFQRVEHHLRDYRILVALAGCHREYVFHWWETTLGRLRRSDMVLQFYRARDAMRSRDPEERKAARARDAKRRKTKSRKEYLAEYEARPEVRAKRAERKRAVRAAAREQSAARKQGSARLPRRTDREDGDLARAVGVGACGVKRTNIRPADSVGADAPEHGAEVDGVDMDAA
jgi:hypothetical protein